MIVAVFWLSASAAWADGVITMKLVADPASWIFGKNELHQSICAKSKDDVYANTAVKVCNVVFAGKFTGANVSIVSLLN